MSLRILENRYLLSIALIILMALLFGGQSALAIVRLSDRTINEAVRYGMENKDESLSSFLGGNWVEGSDGALLNIYTPFMEIARSVARRKPPDNITPETIEESRKNVIKDIDYIWHHPTVKFMVSIYGDDSGFAKRYFARIEGVGSGRSFEIYPSKSIPQYLADEEKNARIKPFTAINAYYFTFDDIAPLDEFVLELYGQDVEAVKFRIYSSDIQ